VIDYQTDINATSCHYLVLYHIFCSTAAEYSLTLQFKQTLQFKLIHM